MGIEGCTSNLIEFSISSFSQSQHCKRYLHSSVLLLYNQIVKDMMFKKTLVHVPEIDVMWFALSPLPRLGLTACIGAVCLEHLL